MRIGVLGVNHKLADLQLREQLSLCCQKRFGSCHIAVDHDLQCVLLSTCNRTEIYFSSHEMATTHSYILNILRSDVKGDFNQKLYSYFESDCFWHLCRVTSGLDSAIMGETEIQGQVKDAYVRTQKLMDLPYELHYLFQKALAIGKKVRNSWPQTSSQKTLEAIITLAREQPTTLLDNPHVLFVGASQINKAIAIALNRYHLPKLTVCNRSYANAKTMALAIDMEILPWEQLTDCWHNFDWIILGTKSQSHLLTAKDINLPLTTPKFIVDLGVPRNVDPLMGKLPGVTLRNIDEINDCAKKESHILRQNLEMKGELLIDKSVKQYVTLFRQKENGRAKSETIAIGTGA